MLENLERKKDTLFETHVVISPNEAEYLNKGDSATNPKQEASQDEATM
jgi:hypothetical protein